MGKLHVPGEPVQLPVRSFIPGAWSRSWRMAIENFRCGACGEFGPERIDKVHFATSCIRCKCGNIVEVVPATQAWTKRSGATR